MEFQNQAMIPMNENNFAERYKTWTSADLVNIIDHPGDYQVLAVEAANLEIENRHLSNVEFEEIRLEHKEKRLEQEKKRQQISAFMSKLFDALNPIQQEKVIADKIVNLIALFFGGLLVYQWIKDFDFLKYMVTAVDATWDFSVVLYFLPILFFPVTGILLWYRKKAGWILAVLFFAYTATEVLFSLIIKFGRIPSNLLPLEVIFPNVFLAVYIGKFLLFGGLTWVMCKKNIRKIFCVNRAVMAISIGIGVLITIVLALMLYIY